MELLGRQTAGKWEDVNCKSAVLQVFPTSLLSHQYLLTPCFSGCTKLSLDWIHENVWNHYWCDRQTATSAWLEKAISSLRVLVISQLQKHKVDLNTLFTAADFNAIRFQEICFLKSKQLIANMGIQGRKGHSLRQKMPRFQSPDKNITSYWMTPYKNTWNSYCGPDQRSVLSATKNIHLPP